MKEPKGLNKYDYRVYTDVFIPDNTHIDVDHPYTDIKGEEGKEVEIKGKPYIRILDSEEERVPIKSEVEIDFFNMTIFMSSKKAKELCFKLKLLFEGDLNE